MAKQVGLLIKGKIDGFSFYHDRLHGYLVRRTGGVSSKAYRTDPRYMAARDASAEFAAVSRAGKLIREAFGPFIDQVKDGTMVNRMNKELVALKQLDDRHSRGERRPETMMADPDSNKCFRIFQFNEGVKLYELLERYPVIDNNGTGTSQTETGLQSPRFNRLAPARDVTFLESGFPDGATHAGLTLIRSVIDFERGSFKTSSSRMVLVARAEKDAINRIPTVNRIPTMYQQDAINRTPTEIVCLQVVFFEEQNGDLVQLKGKVHSMGIISISNCISTCFERRDAGEKANFSKKLKASSLRGTQMCISRRGAQKDAEERRRTQKDAINRVSTPDKQISTNYLSAKMLSTLPNLTLPDT